MSSEYLKPGPKSKTKPEISYSPEVMTNIVLR